MRHTLPGVIVGALTTAATFYAFLATEFRGMTELGFLTGSGILIFLLCVIFVFPAVLILVERRRGTKRKLRVHALGSGRVVRASLRTAEGGDHRLDRGRDRRRRSCAKDVRFNDSLQGLRATGNDAVRMQEEVTQQVRPVVRRDDVRRARRDRGRGDRARRRRRCRTSSG